MSWGTRRRNNIIFFVILLLVIPVAVGLFLIFYEKPTCFDNKKNNNEKGIDCGGNCTLLCTDDTLAPVVIWERFFKVSEGNYSVAAYVENQNPSAGVKNGKYTFTLFNKEGVILTEKKGSIHLFPKSVTPIIENGLNTAKQIPTRVEFKFDEDIYFEKEEPLPKILVVKNDKYFIDQVKNGGPKVTATIQNISLDSVKNIEVIVLLYDVFDNIVGSSSTFIEQINGEESKDITFTWPNLFADPELRPEIIPIYEPNF